MDGHTPQRSANGVNVVSTVILSSGPPLPVRRPASPPPAEAVPAARSLTAEVTHRLRRRLRVAFLILAGVFGAAGGFGLANLLLADQPPERTRQGLLTFAVPMVTVLALTALLWSRRPLSLRALRCTELALVGLFALVCVWKQETYMAYAPELVQRFGAAGVALLGGYHGLFWFALLTMYGLFVPNTWRRCSAVVAAIAACPVTYALIRSGSPGHELAGPPLLGYLIVLGFWSVFGGLLAVFGSFHIASLHQEVTEARRLGPYRLIRKLGAGGMGEVYLAEHSLLKRPCAVKFIRAEQAGDPHALRRFEREVRVTAGLTHPNTIQVFDYGHTPDGTFYYAMEYVPGLNLEELVRHAGPLPPGRVVRVLRQLCGALAEAHATGLIHRDIKPGNVILGERGGQADVAKLLDFGLVSTPASGDDKLTREGAITGTPAYMSPEQAAGRGDLGPASDVYSLGALAHFLLTGLPLFPGRSAMQVLAAHMYEAPDPPSKHRAEIPAGLEAVVVRCVAKHVGDRFPDIPSLDAALGACDAASAWSAGEATDCRRGRAGLAVACAETPAT